MIFLTGVNWIKPNKRVRLGRINVEEAKQFLGEGHFSTGTMGPKIEASIRFLESGGKKVLIAGQDDLAEALRGKAGTVIEP